MPRTPQPCQGEARRAQIRGTSDAVCPESFGAIWNAAACGPQPPQAASSARTSGLAHGAAPTNREPRIARSALRGIAALSTARTSPMPSQTKFYQLVAAASLPTLMAASVVPLRPSSWRLWTESDLSGTAEIQMRLGQVEWISVFGKA